MLKAQGFALLAVLFAAISMTVWALVFGAISAATAVGALVLGIHNLNRLDKLAQDQQKLAEQVGKRHA